MCSLDPFRGYVTALRTSRPQAVRVLDAFPRRAARLARGRRCSSPPAAGAPRSPRPSRRPALPGAAALGQRGEVPPQQLENALVRGDRSGQLTEAWIIAQELQLLYRRSHDLAEARHRLWPIWTAAPAPKSRNCSGWPAHWTPGDPSCSRHSPRPASAVSNGPTEAVNALIKKVKKVGHGFRNLDNYRLRLLLAAGVDWRTPQWQASPATGIRGHSPRFVA